MTEILLFHHAQGLTTGVRAFADDLRAAGHDVHTPDLYDGNTFDDLDARAGRGRGSRGAVPLPG
jgi:dienelactone hydrolase